MIEYFKFQPGKQVVPAAKETTSAPSQPETERHSTVSNHMRRMVAKATQPSLIAKFMALDPIINDAFEERAAILEYDAGVPRAEAEFRAFREIMAKFKELQAA